MAVIRLGDGVQVVTEAPSGPPPAPTSPRRPRAAVVAPLPGPPGKAGPPGPQGPPGSGGGTSGTAWWTGNGPPEAVIGAKPGDKYIDLDTGDVYTLGD